MEDTAAAQVFIEPVDMLALRGNQLFGEPGSFGRSMVPPWPSVAAGALRSALLADRGYDFGAFARGEVEDVELGTPKLPGTFTITAFQIARRHADREVEPLYGVPADLSVANAEHGELEVRRIAPHGGIAVCTSSSTPQLPVLGTPNRAKPVSECLITAEGWRRHLAGEDLDQGHTVRSAELWRSESRIGIALDSATRTAADGALFTSEGIVFRKREHGRGNAAAQWDVGFLVEVAGTTLPNSIMLRFGGDAHAARANRVSAELPVGDYLKIASAGRCRLILTTPGIFEKGWLPTGVTGTGRDLRFSLHGVEGRLICAAVPRAQTISGFDVAAGRPKPAQRAAPTGSVYWLDDLQGSTDDLRNLAIRGFWRDPSDNASRRAEGFNRVAIATWA